MLSVKLLLKLLAWSVYLACLPLSGKWPAWTHCWDGITGKASVSSFIVVAASLIQLRPRARKPSNLWSSKTFHWAVWLCSVVNAVLLMQCCWGNVVYAVLLMQCCWCRVVNAVLLMQCCRCSVVDAVLLMQCCWCSVVDTVLLMQCCWYSAVDAVLLMQCRD